MKDETPRAREVTAEVRRRFHDSGSLMHNPQSEHLVPDVAANHARASANILDVELPRDFSTTVIKHVDQINQESRLELQQNLHDPCLFKTTTFVIFVVRTWSEFKIRKTLPRILVHLIVSNSFDSFTA